jgi:hypothetical protein
MGNKASWALLPFNQSGKLPTFHCSIKRQISSWVLLLFCKSLQATSTCNASSSNNEIQATMKSDRGKIAR